MRLPRLSMPDVAHHVLLRSNNKERLFLCSHDYQVYLQFFSETSAKHACVLNAYVLMPDHIHLLLTPIDAKSVSKLIQSMGRKYAQYFNIRNNREGSLFMPRFKSALVSPEYELDVMRYVEFNPMRSGLVGRPEDYKWSSYRCLDPALDREDCFIQPSNKYKDLGRSDGERFRVYKQICSEPLAVTTLHMFRVETNRSGVIGGEMLVERSG